MQSNIYKKILEQIIKYNLESNFNNMEELNELVFSLNKVQINNFLSISGTFNNNNKEILCNQKFLSSKYFQHDEANC